MFKKPWIIFSRSDREIGPLSEETAPEVACYEFEMGWLTFTFGMFVGWRVSWPRKR